MSKDWSAQFARKDVEAVEFDLGHEYVSPACTHREHQSCEPVCTYCQQPCLCVCHRWNVTLRE